MIFSVFGSATINAEVSLSGLGCRLQTCRRREPQWLNYTIGDYFNKSPKIHTKQSMV